MGSYVGCRNIGMAAFLVQCSSRSGGGSNRIRDGSAGGGDRV